MRVESLSASPDRAGRYRVEFSDGTALKLYPQTVGDYGIYSGKELTPEAYRALKQGAGQMSAKMRAVRIVAAGSVSEGDLESRLRHKGESPEDARDAVAWMRELSLIDDLTTAKQLVRRGVAKGYGINRLRQMLYEKKIPRELWDEALEDLPEPDDDIMSFLRQRLGAEWDNKEQKRAIDALMRRGHTWGDIRRCLSRLGTSMEYEPEE